MYKILQKHAQDTQCKRWEIGKKEHVCPVFAFKYVKGHNTYEESWLDRENMTIQNEFFCSIVPSYIALSDRNKFAGNF